MTAVRFVENDAPCQLCHQREAFVEVTHEGRILAACPDCIEAHAAEANGEPPVDMDADPGVIPPDFAPYFRGCIVHGRAPDEMPCVECAS